MRVACGGGCPLHPSLHIVGVAALAVVIAIEILFTVVIFRTAVTINVPVFDSMQRIIIVSCSTSSGPPLLLLLTLTVPLTAQQEATALVFKSPAAALEIHPTTIQQCKNDTKDDERAANDDSSQRSSS
jgi:hypothetical protein